MGKSRRSRSRCNEGFFGNGAWVILLLLIIVIIGGGFNNQDECYIENC